MMEWRKAGFLSLTAPETWPGCMIHFSYLYPSKYVDVGSLKRTASVK
jgi:hypothetical protein